jgi:hypothetical protein
VLAEDANDDDLKNGPSAVNLEKKAMTTVRVEIITLKDII